MQDRKRLRLFSALVALIILVGGGIAIYLLVRPEPLPLDSPKAAEIQAALVRMYVVETRFVCHPETDVAILAEVVADSPDYKPDEVAQAKIQWVFGSQGQEHSGYLSYLQANYLAQRPEYAMPRPTGVAPTQPPKVHSPSGKCDDSKPRMNVVISSIALENEDMAIVRFIASGGCTSRAEAIMRRKNERWMVTSVRQTARLGCG